MKKSKTFAIDVWMVETPLPKAKKNYKYHHLIICNEGVFMDGTMLAKGNLKINRRIIKND